MRQFWKKTRERKFEKIFFLKEQKFIIFCWNDLNNLRFFFNSEILFKVSKWFPELSRLFRISFNKFRVKNVKKIRVKNVLKNRVKNIKRHFFNFVTGNFLSIWARFQTERNFIPRAKHGRIWNELPPPDYYHTFPIVGQHWSYSYLWRFRNAHPSQYRAKK